MNFKQEIMQGIPPQLPDYPAEEKGVSHAPERPFVLNTKESAQALKNALRYFPEHMHRVLADEFAKELETYGRIYMYRFRPSYEMKARNVTEYPGKSLKARAIMHMIQNNLDVRVAQYPYELVTYGGNGTVFQNWAQYLTTMQYLSRMTDDQTLVLYSGHPLGLFKSDENAPIAVITNGMVVPNYSSREDYDKMAAMGVTSYGQMTAGSFMYIGPQGIVHGTTITLLGAGRKYLKIEKGKNLAGKLYVSSGLGGMSGAQAKAATIAGAVSIIAEINPEPLKKRFDQGWLMDYTDDLSKLLKKAEKAKKTGEPLSIGYLGNIVDLWEKIAKSDFKVELGSDQTSLHNPYMGGYYPAGLSFEKANDMMTRDPDGFKNMVQSSLRRQVKYIDIVSEHGMYFWDYGNAFLLEASRAGAENLTSRDGTFKYPSYVEDIMGPECFDYGFGPFRWVCISGDMQDLNTTDRIAAEILEKQMQKASDKTQSQLEDNLMWIKKAGENKMVVGSKARILYADRMGRIELALAFNEAVAKKQILAPVVLGRDHHDVSGTDSPFRETANITDGSSKCADMAVHNFAGDSMRGATWVSLHNGGGVGWGEVINGGFGMVLDGSREASENAKNMLSWDVANGLARRAWAGNEGANYAVKKARDEDSKLSVTLPEKSDDTLVANAIKKAFLKK